MQGEVWWADLPDPAGSGPGFRRPVVVIQGDAFNRSRIGTVVCLPLTTNLRLAEAPGNILLSTGTAGVSRESVVNVSQPITLDRELLSERLGKLSPNKVQAILAGLDIVLGR